MNNKAHLRPKDFDSNGDIIPMACKEEKGDLISREALREDLFIKFGNQLPNGLLDEIDNAPTVKPCENCDLYFKAMTKEEMKKGEEE